MRTVSLWSVPSTSIVEDLVQSTYLKLWENNCKQVRDFAIQHPEAILGYLKKTAANITHDHFKHCHSQSAGGDELHVSTSDVDASTSDGDHGSQNHIAGEVFLEQIDKHLKRILTGADQERDRTIFWLYFRQGMSAREIAAMPFGLSLKGVGSVLERLKLLLRRELVGDGSSLAEQEREKKQNLAETRLYFCEGSGNGRSTR
jgi:RNA polymerase sigma-70 factor (ECF subfamily)